MQSIPHGAFAPKEQTFQKYENSTPAKPCETSAPAREIHGEAVREAAGPGLVSSLTKGTPSTQPDKIILDPQQMRLRRLRRAVITSARLHQAALTSTKTRFRAAMLTLTYADIDGWKPQHIKDFLRHVRQFLNRKGIKFRYIWIAELQERGAVHYHIMLWLPRGFTLPMPDKRGWWTHGNTKIEWARKPVAYLAKYASKTHSKGGSMPRGIRLFGIGGLELEDRRERSWWMLPQYIRNIDGVPNDEEQAELVQTARTIGNTKRAKGGGWLTPYGEWFPSKYIITAFNPLTIKENPAWA